MRKAWLLVLVVATGLGVGLLATSSASAATDVYLKLDGIKGDSQSPVAKDQIDVRSFSWGVSNAGGGAKKAPPAVFSDLTITKDVDSASPALMLAAASGQTIPSGVLTVVRAGQDASTAYSLCMSGLRVTSDQTSGSSELNESVSFSYASIVEIYHPQAADGKPLPAIVGGWDLVHNLQFGDSSSC